MRKTKTLKNNNLPIYKINEIPFPIDYNFSQVIYETLNYIIAQKDLKRSIYFEENVFKILNDALKKYFTIVEDKTNFYKSYPTIKQDIKDCIKEKSTLGKFPDNKRDIPITNFIIKNPRGSTCWPDFIISYNYKYYVFELKTTYGNNLQCGATVPTPNTLYILKYGKSESTVYFMAQEIIDEKEYLNISASISHSILRHDTLKCGFKLNTYLRPHYALSLKTSKENYICSLKVKENVYNFLKNMEE